VNDRVIEINKIHFPSEERLRQEYGKVKELAQSLVQYGQLQDVLVRRPNVNEEIPDTKEFILVDGGRRMLAILYCNKTDNAIPNLESGYVGVKFRGEEDELFALELEYHSNEDRKDFNWKEQMNYIHKIHLGHMDREEWSPQHTCALLSMGQTTLYRYLELADSKDILEHPDVAEADSFRTAYKQYQRIKKIRQRQAIVEHRAKTGTKVAKKKDGGDTPTEVSQVDALSGAFDEEGFVPPSEYSQAICQRADCREWIKLWKDESFDFVHWDPPYGAEQGGGAFSPHPDIDDSPEYAFSLMKEVLPEIFRTLVDGHWLALWFHPSHYTKVRDLLDENGFWVNPYPNIWYKVDRLADGQEIKRFLTNAYENFFFAAKSDKDNDAILLRNDRQNVFTFKMVERKERTHIMEKPPSLLGEILSCISIKHEFGADLSVGSGSIYEAACFNARSVVGCEIDEAYSVVAQERASEALIESGAQAFDFEYNLIESADSDHIRKFIPGYEEGFAKMFSHSEKS